MVDAGGYAGALETKGSRCYSHLQLGFQPPVHFEEAFFASGTAWSTKNAQNDRAFKRASTNETRVNHPKSSTLEGPDMVQRSVASEIPGPFLGGGGSVGRHD